MRTASLVLLTTGACLLVVAPAAAAQGCATTGIITGIATSEAGGAIPGVELSAPGAPPVTSDSAGRFRIPAACAGPTLLSARRIGYTATTWNVMVPSGGSLRVDITLVPVAHTLEPVMVRARETPGAVRLRDFYTRRQRNPGYFLTREDLEPYDHGVLSDALRSRVPGVQVASSSGLVRSRIRLRGQRCAPMVWLDGMSTPAGEFDLDALQPSSLMGIEIYSGPATTPAEFRTPFGRDACGGVIVVWSRVGPDQWDVPRARRNRDAADPSPELPIYRASEVDTPARIDSASMPSPMYPDSLYVFAVEGSALAEFVVDTTGRPVVGTAKIVSATSPAFGEAVLRAVAFARFHPARKADRPVRQVMQIPFEFSLDRGS